MSSRAAAISCWDAFGTPAARAFGVCFLADLSDGANGAGSLVSSAIGDFFRINRFVRALTCAFDQVPSILPCERPSRREQEFAAGADVEVVVPGPGGVGGELDF